MSLFSAGTISVSVEVIARGIDISSYIVRHEQGDWNPDDRLDNEWAIQHGQVINSFFPLADGDLLCVVTFMDSSTTQVFLESEYQTHEKGARYLLPNPGGTRDDYLDAVRGAGFDIMEVRDAPLSEAPEDFIPVTLRRDHGSKPFCLIVWVRKPAQ